MKIRHIFGIIAVTMLILHFAAGGLVGFQSQEPVNNIAFEKAPSGEIQIELHPEAQTVRNESIFSTATLLILVVAVMGIVAFRRNTYS